MLPLQIEFVRSHALIPSEVWDACFPPPLEGRWLYDALERSDLSDQFLFSYAFLRDQNGPLGIAPLFLMNVPLSIVLPDFLLPLARWLDATYPSIVKPRTLFVGCPCSDEGTVGLLPNVARDRIFPSLQVALERKAHEMGATMLVWKDVPQHPAEVLDWVAQKRRLVRLVSFPGTELALPKHKQAYFAKLKSSHRKRLRWMLRRSSDRIDLSVEVLQQPDGPTIREMFRLFWQSYENAKTKFERLNITFFELLAAQPHTYFIVLREASTREMVACSLCFLLGDRVINKFTGLDYQRPENSFLYTRLWDAIVDWTLSVEGTTIQSGQTGYSHKLLTGHVLIPLYNYCHYKSRIMHFITKAVSRSIGWKSLRRDLKIALKAHPELENVRERHDRID